MKKIVTLLLMTLLCHVALSCSVTQDFIFPEIPESAILAGAILVGTVEQPPPKPPAPEGNQVLFISPFRMKNSVYLTNVQYYKGCGPSRVKVSGYSSSSMCGIGAPDSGKRVIVFVCKDGDGWKLNRIAPYSGQFEATNENLKLLSDSVGDFLTCEQNSFAYKKCLRRNPENTKRNIKGRSIKPILIEPLPISENPKKMDPTPPILVDNSQNMIQNRRQFNVSSQVRNQTNGNSTIDSRFPIIPRPIAVKLNQQSSLVSEMSKAIPNEFNSHFSGLFDE